MWIVNHPVLRRKEPGFPGRIVYRNRRIQTHPAFEFPTFSTFAIWEYSLAFRTTAAADASRIGSCLFALVMARSLARVKLVADRFADQLVRRNTVHLKIRGPRMTRISALQTICARQSVSSVANPNSLSEQHRPQTTLSANRCQQLALRCGNRAIVPRILR